jgi:hypothetical protein
LANPKRAAEAAGEVFTVRHEPLNKALSPEVLQLECKGSFHAERIRDLKVFDAKAPCCPTRH